MSPEPQKASAQASHRVQRNAALWNTAAGMLNAGQSAVVLIFISHLLGIETAGTVTLAYAAANLFTMAAKYGIRSFQVTDTAQKYAFSSYRRARCISSAAVTCVAVCYLIFQTVSGSYSPDKALIVFLFVLWKMIDAVEDVYYGMYQQKGRLDIGAKAYALRLAFSTALLCLLIVFRLPFWLTMLAVLLLSLGSAVYFIRKTLPAFPSQNEKTSFHETKALLLVCLPLFIGSALSTFIGNAPKYLIDWYLDARTQAIFGYIMMPAFVIQVLNQFIYQPIIKTLGDLYAAGNTKAFVRRVMLQYLIVAVLTAAAVGAGLLAGIPLLSLLYNTDLSPYRAEFTLLLAGGGLFALSSFLMVPLTTIRFQSSIAAGFSLVTLLCLLLGKSMVQSGGIMGAARLYLLLNAALVLLFTLCFFLGLAKKNFLVKPSP